MATNTTALKTFAQETRRKLISLVATKMDFILTQDTAQLRGYESQISKLKRAIREKGKDLVVEEVAYTWFNRVMALRYMDANEYTSPRVVTPAEGQMRPEILQEAMAGSIDEDLHVRVDDNPREAELYRRLLVAVNNSYGNTMPFLFEHIANYTEMLLPDDLLSEQSFVTDIRRGMTDDDCQNVEIMGWLYQFYITDRKADAETKKSKKGGLKSDEQAAATQLFTPHWVVRYMVENSLGRIWMTLHPESNLVKEMPYYIATPDGQTDPVPDDIHSVHDIRFIDPCMGSGHVLVYAFDLLAKMYEEEGYQTREIPALILENNIYGIDIDPRCYQLASFALTMKARAYHSRYLRKAVDPHVIALHNIDRDTIERAGAWSAKSTMWQFENVDTIGSLLQITPEDCEAIQVEEGLFGETQKVLKMQAEYLSRKYHCVVTNPPYLGKGFCDVLKNYVTATYPNSKSDLYAAFFECLANKVCENGYTGLVTMESWMFLSSFEKLRNYILDNKTIISLSHFDWHIMRIAFGTVAFVLQNKKPGDYKGVYSYLSRYDVDLQKELPYIFPKTDNGRYGIKSQKHFEKIPGSPIGYWVSEKMLDAFDLCKLGTIGEPKSGIMTGNSPKYCKLFHEVNLNNIGFGHEKYSDIICFAKRWFPIVAGGTARKWYGNLDTVVNLYNNGEDIQNNVVNYRLRDPKYYFKESITWPKICSGITTFRICPKGVLFGDSGLNMFLESNMDIIHGFLNSKIARHILKVINPTFNTQVSDIANLPIKNVVNSAISSIVQDNISISRLDWDSHETSWDFRRNPIYEEQLQVFVDEIADTMPNVTVDDISDYHAPHLLQPLDVLVDNYKSKWEDLFHQLHRNEEELNRQFIEIYGLQDELTPDVPLSEITILQKGEISIEEGAIVWHEDVIVKQLISYLVGCFMGRYSIDRPGLIIASQHQDLNALGLKVEGIDNGASGSITIDDDGIVPVLEGEYFPDDMTVRIEQAIKTIFGEDHFYDNLRYVNEKLGKPLREYLFKDFYADHLDGKMYQRRPIYWLFSSKMGDKKKKGYFKALVYMHRIEADTLSKLHADYVSPYIDKIEQQKAEAEDNAMRDDLTTPQRNKASKLAAELASQLHELKDFATTLAEMSTQRLTIDLDDGVRTNYPKFYPLVEPIKGLDKEE